MPKNGLSQILKSFPLVITHGEEQVDLAADFFDVWNVFSDDLFLFSGTGSQVERSGIRERMEQVLLAEGTVLDLFVMESGFESARESFHDAEIYPEVRDMEHGLHEAPPFEIESESEHHGSRNRSEPNGVIRCQPRYERYCERETEPTWNPEEVFGNVLPDGEEFVFLHGVEGGIPRSVRDFKKV